MPLPIFRRGTRWQNPEQSVGTLYRQVGRLSCWEAIGEVRRVFIEAESDIKLHLNCYSREPIHRVHCTVYMIGRKESTSEPTIMFWCESPTCKENCRKKAKALVERGGIMEKYPGFRVADCSRPPDFDQLVQLASTASENSTDLDVSVEDSNNQRSHRFFGLPDYQYWPLISSDIQDELRLLAITRGHSMDNLSLRLFQVMSQQAPDYCAFSYSHSRISDVDVEIVEVDEKQYEIPTRLAQSLRKLRSQYTEVVIWLDVMCIDPGSTYERRRRYVSISQEAGRALHELNSHGDGAVLNTAAPVLGLQAQIHDMNRITAPPNITLGGLLYSDTEFFCLTAAHAFTTTTDSKNVIPSDGSGFEWSIGEEEGEDDDDFDSLELGMEPVESTSRGSATPDMDDSHSSSDAAAEPSKKSSSTPGVNTSEPGEHSTIPDPSTTGLELGIASDATQPVDPSFRPIPGPASADGEFREVIGYLAMLSSDAAGVIRPNLDYALIKISPPQAKRLQALVRKSSPSTSLLSTNNIVLSRYIDNREVVAGLGSAGTVRGTLSGTPTYVRDAITASAGSGAGLYQELWTVRLHSKLSVGDCGSWILDAISGDLVGHIVSGSPDTGVAYIVPAKDIFKDIEGRRGIPMKLLVEAIPHVILEPERSSDEVQEKPKNLQDASETGNPIPLNALELQEVEFSRLQSSSKDDLTYHERTSEAASRWDFNKNPVLELVGDDGPVLKKKRKLRTERHPNDNEQLPLRDLPRIEVQNPEEPQFTGLNYTSKTDEPYERLYEYKALQAGEDIRVFRLMKGARDEPVRGVITHTTLQSVYQALTYEWGPGTIQNKVELLEEDTIQNDLIFLRKRGSIFIRQNLYSALLALRDQDHHVDFWIDAICMDRSDYQELQDQVSKIGEVYEHAEKVMVWLGDPSPQNPTILAFDFAAKLRNLFHLDLTVNDDHANDWWSLAKVMKNSLFSRRWVLIEFALGRDIHLFSGTKSFDWQDFADSVSLFVLKFEQIRQLPRWKRLMLENSEPFADIRNLPVSLWVDVLRKATRKDEDGEIVEYFLNLEELVTALVPFETSDPRDVVNALLPLARKDLGVKTLPTFVYESAQSYEKALVEVYTDFVEHSVVTSKSLDIICRHWAPDQDLPSWMPSKINGAHGRPWNVSTERSMGDSLVGLPGKSWYNASAGLSTEPHNVVFGRRTDPSKVAGRRSFSYLTIDSTPYSSVPRAAQWGELLVKGVMKGEVGLVGPRCASASITEESLRFGGWVPAAERYQATDFIPEELWRTLVAGRGDDGQQPPHWYFRAFQHVLELVDTGSARDIDTRTLIETAQSSIIVEFLKRVRDVMWNRAFFRTKGSQVSESLLGLGPPGMQEGDLMCILLGCSVPVILRQKEGEKPGRFELIGECYCHAIMDGYNAKSLDEKTMEGKRDLRWFTLV